jgi:hypothetical protein
VPAELKSGDVLGNNILFRGRKMSAIEEMGYINTDLQGGAGIAIVNI